MRRSGRLQAAALVAAAGSVLTPVGGASAAAGLRAQQDMVVTRNHQGAIDLARLAVSETAATVAGDQAAVASDQADQERAAGALVAATVRLSVDHAALVAAIAHRRQADATVAADRTRLRAIAIGMYTGALTNPQPASLRELEAEQQQVIDAAEVGLVARVVDADLHSDLAADRQAVASERAAAGRVVADRSQLAAATRTEEEAAARTTRDRAALASDSGRLAAADRQLATAEAQLAVALRAVAGPPSAPSGQLSLLGGPALDAAQMVAWYQAQGYVDLTTAPIAQLAAWYLQAGTYEGVRGDVAFAQAVLETGGFSSPDAVDFSNFAGIGHCDTCATGWRFPSPAGGVLGQVQLLRIFAAAGPPPRGAPRPVLPVLTAAKQMRAGCCATVESLTGVWATDPTYGSQILAIYASMLEGALSGPA